MWSIKDYIRYSDTAQYYAFLYNQVGNQFKFLLWKEDDTLPNFF